MSEMFGAETLNAIDFMKQLLQKADDNKKAEEEENEKRIKTERELDEVNKALNFGEETTQVEEEDESINSPKVALFKSLNKFGSVNLDYISKITNLSKKDALISLKNYIYQNPKKFDEDPFQGWETKEEYLNGNLKVKLEEALIANETYHGIFQRNIDLIRETKANLPRVLGKDIFVSLSSSWIPVNIFEDFVLYLNNLLEKKIELTCSIDRDEHLKTYKVNLYQENRGGIRYANDLFLTRKYVQSNEMNFTAFFEKCLEGKNIIITKEEENNGKKTRVKDEKATLFFDERQKEINDMFIDWVNSSKDLLDEIEDSYNAQFCNNYVRRYDGSFLELDDINPKVEIREYQKDAVARMILAKNTLLAHDVGSGKTYEMIVAAHELYKMGLSKRNLIAVPNTILSQWKQSYEYLYKDAKIFVISPEKFNRNKNKYLQLISEGKNLEGEDFETVIIGHSTLDMIPISEEISLEEAREEYKILCNSIVNKGLERRKTLLLKKIDKLKQQIADASISIGFKDLGISRLFIDESHFYKNLEVGDEGYYANGISAQGSKKASDLYKKVRTIQNANDGGGVVFATGTPITNSIAEIYIIQKYLSENMLEILNLETFPKWINTFSKKDSVFEIDIDTNKSRMVQRYNKFYNLTELSSLLANLATFHTMTNSDSLPIYNGPETIQIEQSKDLKKFIESLGERIELIRRHKPREFKVVDKEGKEDAIKDNLLLITSEGKKAALDMRLIDKKYHVDPESKVFLCAKQIIKKYHESADFLGAQVVFCDSSIPKKEFNLYDELKGVLVTLGIPENEIDFVHNYETDKEREKLFLKINKGELRVILGSTFKLGTGVNIQERLCALHHLDIPRRPADMIQREGRIYRQGNTCKEISIYRYITKNSFDSYSWQILERKQKFIDGLLSNSIFERTADDISETALSYGEAKALALGNKLLRERVETENELNRILSLNSEINRVREDNENRLASLNIELPNLKKRIEEMENDLKYNATLTKSSISDFITDELASKILEKVDEAIEAKEDIEIGNLVGYKIIAPKYQVEDEEKWFVILERKGTYNLILGKNEKGLKMRLNNFYNNFEKRFDELSKEYEAKIIDLRGLETALETKIDYTDKINELKDKISSLDEKINGGK